MKAEYISRIVIDSLWSGRKHVDWQLRPDVNILSGVNGVGKSTILNRVANHLLNSDRISRSQDGVTLTLSPENAELPSFEIIHSFDRPAITNELLSKMAGIKLHSELDFQLYQLQRRYLDYQVNLSNQMIEILTSQSSDAQRKVSEIAYQKTRFQDMVDSLFKETGKHIDRTANEIYFLQHEERIGTLQLSSGEKQILIILLTALVLNHQPCVMLMDEPEVSLHIEWQQQIISLIRELNPHAQIILTTHSPAVIMDGWADCVTDVEDIVS